MPKLDNTRRDQNQRPIQKLPENVQIAQQFSQVTPGAPAPTYQMGRITAGPQLEGPSTLDVIAGNLDLTTPVQNFQRTYNEARKNNQKRLSEQYTSYNNRTDDQGNPITNTPEENQQFLQDYKKKHAIDSEGVDGTTWWELMYKSKGVEASQYHNDLLYDINLELADESDPSNQVEIINSYMHKVPVPVQQQLRKLKLKTVSEVAQQNYLYEQNKLEVDFTDYFTKKITDNVDALTEVSQSDFTYDFAQALALTGGDKELALSFFDEETFSFNVEQLQSMADATDFLEVQEVEDYYKLSSRITNSLFTQRDRVIKARNKKEDVPALSERNFRDNLDSGNINFLKKQFIRKLQDYESPISAATALFDMYQTTYDKNDTDKARLRNFYSLNPDSKEFMRDPVIRSIYEGVLSQVQPMTFEINEKGEYVRLENSPKEDDGMWASLKSIKTQYKFKANAWIEADNQVIKTTGFDGSPVRFLQDVAKVDLMNPESFKGIEIELAGEENKEIQNLIKERLGEDGVFGFLNLTDKDTSKNERKLANVILKQMLIRTGNQKLLKELVGNNDVELDDVVAKIRKDMLNNTSNNSVNKYLKTIGFTSNEGLQSAVMGLSGDPATIFEEKSPEERMFIKGDMVKYLVNTFNLPEDEVVEFFEQGIEGAGNLSTVIFTLKNGDPVQLADLIPGNSPEERRYLKQLDDMYAEFNTRAMLNEVNKPTDLTKFKRINEIESSKDVTAIAKYEVAKVKFINNTQQLSPIIENAFIYKNAQGEERIFLNSALAKEAGFTQLARPSEHSLIISFAQARALGEQVGLASALDKQILGFSVASDFVQRLTNNLAEELNTNGSVTTHNGVESLVGLIQFFAGAIRQKDVAGSYRQFIRQFAQNMEGLNEVGAAGLIDVVEKIYFDLENTGALTGKIDKEKIENYLRKDRENIRKIAYGFITEPNVDVSDIKVSVDNTFEDNIKFFNPEFDISSDTDVAYFMIDALTSDSFLETFGVYETDQRNKIKSILSGLKEQKKLGEDIEPYQILDLLDKPEGQDVNLLPINLLSVLSSGSSFNLTGDSRNSLTSGAFVRRDSDGNSTGGVKSYAYSAVSNNRMNDRARARRFFNIISEQAFGMFSNNDVRRRVLAFGSKAPRLNKFALIDLVKQDNIGVRPFIINNGFDNSTSGVFNTTISGNMFADQFFFGKDFLPAYIKANYRGRYTYTHIDDIPNIDARNDLKDALAAAKIDSHKTRKGVIYPNKANGDYKTSESPNDEYYNIGYSQTEAMADNFYNKQYEEEFIDDMFSQNTKLNQDDKNLIQKIKTRINTEGIDTLGQAFLILNEEVSAVRDLGQSEGAKGFISILKQDIRELDPFGNKRNTNLFKDKGITDPRYNNRYFLNVNFAFDKTKKGMPESYLPTIDMVQTSGARYQISPFRIPYKYFIP